MKKILLAGSFMCLSFGAFAQLEIGLKVTPNMAWHRVETTDAMGIDSDGSRMHLSGGIVADYFFSDNYAFSTGLLLSTKGGKLNRQILTTKVTSDVMVQYVELPVTLKLFTNEIAPDARLYFQLGGAAGFLTSARMDNEKNITYLSPTTSDPFATTTEKVSKSFNTIELSALLGGGVEYQLGESTKVFGGLHYQHGLTNIDDDTFLGGEDKSNNLTIKNSVIGIDLGIKF